MHDVGRVTSATAAAAASAPPSRVQQPRREDMVVVKEADGFKLHLSNRNPTGYCGVYSAGERYKAQQTRGGKLHHLGTFDTAVEAAVAYAKHVIAIGGAEPEMEDEDNAEAEVVEEAGGFKLHLSRKNSTGYRGVYLQQGHFKARLMSGGKQIYLGGFDTAVEAAMAYAQHVGGTELEEEAEQEEEEEVVVEAEAEAEVVKEADGFKLHLSSQSSTGYRGVHVNGSRFLVNGPKQVYVGMFGTAVQGAVAYAQYVASLGSVELNKSSPPLPSPQPPQPPQPVASPVQRPSALPPSALPPSSLGLAAPAPLAIAPLAASGGMEEVRALLASYRLEQYAEAFDEQGYDDLSYLRTLDAVALGTVLSEIGMKPGQ